MPIAISNLQATSDKSTKLATTAFVSGNITVFGTP